MFYTHLNKKDAGRTMSCFYNLSSTNFISDFGETDAHSYC